MNPTAAQDLARRAVRGDKALSQAGYTPAQIANAAPASRLQHARISQATAGTYPLVSGVAGQRIEVYELFLWSEAAQDFEIFDGVDSLTGLLKGWPAQNGLLLPFTGEPHFETTAGAALNLTFSAAGQVSGWLRYRMVS